MNKFWIVFTRTVYHYNWYLSLGSVMAWRNTGTRVPCGRNPGVNNITWPTSSFTPCHHRKFIVQQKSSMPALCWCQPLCAPLLVRKLASAVCREIPGWCIALISLWHSAMEGNWSIKRLPVIQEARITLEIEVSWIWARIGWDLQTLLK